MKRLFLVALALCLVLAAVPAMAENLLDGRQITVGPWIVIETEGYATGAPRYFNPGEAWGNQETQVRLPMSALIPCYLEMLFQGNDVNALLQSWGPDANADYAPGNMYLAFHPEVGGYIHADWSLYPDSHDNNYEAPLGDDSFIRGCDTFKTQLWSNMNYKYTVSVKDGGLKGGLDANAVLPVDMRAAVSVTDPGLANAVWGGTHTFLADGDAVLVDGGNFLQSRVIYQQFRVPFNRSFSAGHYTGEITFTAATI
jgi:hypothetical protein